MEFCLIAKGELILGSLHWKEEARQPCICLWASLVSVSPTLELFLGRSNAFLLLSCSAASTQCLLVLITPTKSSH